MFAKRGKNQNIFCVVGQEKKLATLYISALPYRPRETANEFRNPCNMHREISDRTRKEVNWENKLCPVTDIYWSYYMLGILEFFTVCLL